jgi:uncharacterized phiE125 gp8 family phage protein
MIFRCTATESTEPVTLAEQKVWMRFGLPTSDTSEDAMISAMIAGAREIAEEKCKRSFVNHTYEIVLDAFPCEATGSIKLPRPPISTTAGDLTITYYNTTDGLTTTIPASAITVDYKSEPGRVHPSYGNEWPDDAIDRPDAITISYKAGNNSICPQPVRDWIKMKAAGYYGQREAFITGTMMNPMGRDFVDGLLDPFRIIEFSL